MENPLRIGNDANFEWSVKKVVGDEKVPYDLTGRNLQLFLVGRVDRIEVTDFVVNENVISWTFFGKDQQHTGIYNALLVENMGEERMVTVDIQYAVTLVPHSWIITGEDGDGCGCVTMDTIYLESAFTMEPGPRGYSAYEVAVQQGYVGTVDEWLESLVGFSPSASVTKEGDTATITITDREGTTTATVRDGSDADVTRENIEEALGGAPVMTETDPNVPDWAKAAEKPSYTADEVGALPDDTTLAYLPDDADHRTVSDAEKAVWDAKSDFSGDYPDLTNKPDLSQFITRSVDDLVNYYLKNEVYTKDEVADLLAGITGGIWVTVSVLPQPSAATYGLKIYLVPSQNPAVQNQKDEYITTRSGSEGSYSYAWEQIGSTAIDISDYVTNEDLQSALEDYVSTEAFQQAMAGKADKDTDAVEGNFAAFDSSGNPVDSGHKHSDYLTSHQDISGKADKVSNPTSGNFAGLDANGNLTDSGSKASDFATAAQGAKADTAYQKPSGGIPSTDMSSDVQTSLGKADTALQSFTETDPTVPAWAKTANKPSYTANEVGALPDDTAIPSALSDLADVSDTAPTDGQALLWDDTNEVWKPGTVQGGGGSVTDVTVGGTSVVNQQGVAEVPEIPEAVQAQEIEIDSAPTANSQNLVTSGGVASALAEKYSKPSGGIPSTDLAPDVIQVIPTDTTIPSGGLEANVHYTLGTLTGSVSITLDTTSEVSGQMNIYSLTFTAGSTAPTITWSSAITQWAGNCLDSNGAPVITAGNSYEVSILDGLAVITEFVA